MQNNNTYVVIMAGGIGSRFWPVSRNARPKQFLDILGVGQSLLQLTFERFKKICSVDQIYIVTNENYRSLLTEQLPEVSEEQILFEPMRKNTAPCVAYACNKIAAINSKANIIIAASDHYILKETVFFEVVQKSLDYVSHNNYLITLGIQPTRPDTGYGYIQFVDDQNEDGVFKVKSFTEKPNRELALAFINSGEFLWNSGLFIWNVKTILKAIQTHLPEIHEAFLGLDKKLTKQEETKRVASAYALCSNISIDFGVMEKATNVRVIPSNFGWSDVGTWASLYDIREHDYHDNAVAGKQVMMYDSVNNMIHADDKKLVVVYGLENYIVIDSPDVLLICPKDQEQKIKDITVDIKRNKGDKFL
jgi:mannose-1-phosphate guanylyltransferase